jgi:aldehyde dehydrogenase (NAD+)
VTDVIGEERLLIDGELRMASGGATFETLNPATEEVLGVSADGTAEDMDAAIAAARRAFDETDWSRDLATRLAGLRQLHAALEKHSDDLRELTIAEVGAPRFLTAGPQLDAPIEALKWVTDLAEGYEWQTSLGRAEPMGMPSDRFVVREAAGVVGAITPWNFPHQLNLAKVAPALAAGCTVVLKPAPDTPWCASVLGRIIAEETDIPAGVVNIVNSSDHQVGALLSADPRVDVVSFTGSTATGKKVMAAGVDTLKRVFLELGGKSAYIVLDDADVSAATMAGFAACSHAGQGCAITTRLVVPRAMYDEAVEATAATMASLGNGDPAEAGTICGPVISGRQRERIEGLLATAEGEGGTFVTGGGRPADRDKGFWIEPTLVAGLDNQATLAQQEVFGPVLVAIPHDGDDDAVRIANESVYGLSGAVTSADPERAWDVARRVRTGTMAVNGGVWFGADVPFGGYKQSGIGREMGQAGFEEYLETKSVAVGA